jgi:DNA repair photolyase
MESHSYEYALGPTSQMYFCSVPFRLDISPFCSMGCRYCFSLARGGKRAQANRFVDPQRLERKLEAACNGGSKVLDINGELLQRRMPIHLGGVSDPFSSEEVTKRTLQILSILSKFDYPLIVSSKQTNQIIQDHILTALKKIRYLTLQVSIPIPNDKLSELVEPGAPVFSDRLKGIRLLCNEEFYVVARLQPIIPSLVKQLIKVGIPAVISSGCRHVITECLKLPVEKSGLFTKLFDLLHWDGLDYYSKKGAIVVGRDRVLPAKVAWENTIGLVELLMKSNMTYGVTDHGLFHFGNTTCCCGVAGREGFDGIFKANFTNTILEKKSNELFFSDVVSNWIPQRPIGRYINSHSRLRNENTFLSNLRDKWNKPGNVNAPDAYIGVNFTGYRDNNGDCVYEKSEVSRFLPAPTKTL